MVDVGSWGDELAEDVWQWMDESPVLTVDDRQLKAHELVMWLSERGWTFAWTSPMAGAERSDRG